MGIGRPRLAPRGVVFQGLARDSGFVMGALRLRAHVIVVALRVVARRVRRRRACASRLVFWP